MQAEEAFGRMQYKEGLILALTLAVTINATDDDWDESLCACDDSCQHPQCGSDGNTYANPCFLKCRNDYLKKFFGKTIQVVRFGNCDSDEIKDPKSKEFKYCGKSNYQEILSQRTQAPTTEAAAWDQNTCSCDAKENNPQCGSDWNTYTNICYVKCRNDYLGRVSGLPIYIVYAGKCFEPILVGKSTERDGNCDLDNVSENINDNNDSQNNYDDSVSNLKESDDLNYYEFSNDDIDANSQDNNENETDDDSVTNIEERDGSENGDCIDDNDSSNNVKELKNEAPATTALKWDQSSCSCNANELNPQCGSDWQTYTNLCFITCRNDHLNKISGHPIYVVHAGKCFKPAQERAEKDNDEEDDSDCDYENHLGRNDDNIDYNNQDNNDYETGDDSGASIKDRDGKNDDCTDDNDSSNNVAALKTKAYVSSYKNVENNQDNNVYTEKTSDRHNEMSHLKHRIECEPSAHNLKVLQVIAEEENEQRREENFNEGCDVGSCGESDSYN